MATAAPYPCLWFRDRAEEAANFYASLLPDSRVDEVWRSPADTPSGPAGMVLTVTMRLAGQRFMLLAGGPADWTFNESISFVIETEDQAETDRLWDALTADGGEPGPCGWLKDRYGVSWQIVPTVLGKMLSDPDTAKAQRVMQAMLRMIKLDIAGLEAAYDGGPAT